MNFWWCNQSRDWDEEFDAWCVCASADVRHAKFHETVVKARQGDITFHYRTGRGIVAVSRALDNPIVCRTNDIRPICVHGRGWAFQVEYHLLTRPVPRKEIEEGVLALALKDSPVIRCKNGKVQVRQEYFIPFSREGAEVVLLAAPELKKVSWILDALHSQSAPPTAEAQ